MNALYTNDLIYRPPPEANSILLEVTVGCSWAQCTFCPEIHEPFRMIPLEQLTQNAARLASMEENRVRDTIFLTGSNVFVLSPTRLAQIFEIVHTHMPWVKHINMYARAADVLAKSLPELRALRDQGLHTLYIGLESGSDKILLRTRKGATSAQMLEAFHRLDQAEILYGLSSILGLGGEEDCMEHITQTAAVYNSCHPASIRVMTLSIYEDTPIYQDVLAGRFTPLSPGDILMEERVFLSMLTVENCLFIGTHTTNNVPVAGFLPQHKQAMLTILDTAIRSMDLDALQERKFDHM